MIDAIRCAIDQSYYDDVILHSDIQYTRTLGGESYDCRRHQDGTPFIVACYGRGLTEIFAGMISFDAFFKELRLYRVRQSLARRVR